MIREKNGVHVPTRGRHPGEKQLLVVDTAHYRMSFYVDGKLDSTVEIGLGQGRGPKEELHDLKTPRGTYFVVDKQKGEFGGEWGEYFGGHWIKINRPAQRRHGAALRPHRHRRHGR